MRIISSKLFSSEPSFPMANAASVTKSNSSMFGKINKITSRRSHFYSISFHVYAARMNKKTKLSGTQRENFSHRLAKHLLSWHVKNRVELEHHICPIVGITVFCFLFRLDWLCERRFFLSLWILINWSVTLITSSEIILTFSSSVPINAFAACASIMSLRFKALSSLARPSPTSVWAFFCSCCRSFCFDENSVSWSINFLISRSIFSWLACFFSRSATAYEDTSLS